MVFNKFIKKRKILRKTLLSVLIVLCVNLYFKKTKISNSHTDNVDIFYKNLTAFFSRSPYDINCDAIFEMNRSEIQKSKKLLEQIRDSNGNIKLLSDSNFIFDKKLCSIFRNIRRYDRFDLNESDQFPIAYSIVAHKDTEQVERLIRLIYHPNNIYCIHVDSKSTALFKQSIKSIADCFDNVFIASKLENVFYASFQRLQADLNCLNDFFSLKNLINKHENFMNKKVVYWNYFINFASTEFPLRTNNEMKKILRVYNGSNEIEIIKKFSLNRIKIKWISKNNRLISTNETKTDPPHKYKIVKGYAFVVISRKFAKYVLYDKKAKDLLEWSKDSWSPDEWYF